MNVVLGAAITVLVVAVAVAAMLLVRRRAPEGSFFADGDRASGVFGVLATGFSILLGFIIFLSFESYETARVGAETEATVVAQQAQTAIYLPEPTSTELVGELVCYARSVAGVEWAALDDGTLDDAINPWGVEMFLTTESLEPESAREQSAYDRWMDQTNERQQARVDRVRGVEGIIPDPLWIVLVVVAAAVFLYMLFFADSAERAVTQALLMGSVATVITLLLLLVAFFDHPHGDGLGRLQPTAMERTLHVLDEQIAAVSLDVDPPCDQDGDRR